MKNLEANQIFEHNLKVSLFFIYIFNLQLNYYLFYCFID